MPTGTRIDWRAFEHELGVTPDAELARRVGCNVKMVAKRRIARGGRRAIGPLGIRWDEQPLGEVPDAVIAERLGCVTSSVRQARTRRGIPACVTLRTITDVRVEVAKELGVAFPKMSLHVAVAEVLEEWAKARSG